MYYSAHMEGKESDGPAYKQNNSDEIKQISHGFCFKRFEIIRQAKDATGCSQNRYTIAGKSYIFHTSFLPRYIRKQALFLLHNSHINGL
jgi:hypothetical protein